MARLIFRGYGVALTSGATRRAWQFTEDVPEIGASRDAWLFDEGPDAPDGRRFSVVDDNRGWDVAWLEDLEAESLFPGRGMDPWAPPAALRDGAKVDRRTFLSSAGRTALGMAALTLAGGALAAGSNALTADPAPAPAAPMPQKAPGVGLMLGLGLVLGAPCNLRPHRTWHELIDSCARILSLGPAEYPARYAELAARVMAETGARPEDPIRPTRAQIESWHRDKPSRSEASAVEDDDRLVTAWLRELES